MPAKTVKWQKQLRRITTDPALIEALEHFIYTKIIEKLIAEIPTKVTKCLYSNCQGECPHLAVANAKVSNP